MSIEKVGKLQEEDLGYQTKEHCPFCETGLLFKNKKNNKWCSKIDCNYHIDSNGMRKKSLVDLNDKKRMTFSRY